MKKNLILVIDLLLIAIIILLNNNNNYNYHSFNQSEKEIYLETKLNNYRKEKGLKILINDNRLCEMASQRLIDIQSNWSHTRFYILSTKFFTNYKNFKLLGENLAKDYENEDELFQSWLDSKTHKNNIEEKNYKYECIKCNKKYCVNIFGK